MRGSVTIQRPAMFCIVAKVPVSKHQSAMTPNFAMENLVCRLLNSPSSSVPNLVNRCLSSMEKEWAYKQHILKVRLVYLSCS